MKHRAKNGDWAERRRIWRHPLGGECLYKTDLHELGVEVDDD